MKKFNVNVNGTVYSVEVEEVGGTVAAAPVAPAAPAAAHTLCLVVLPVSQEPTTVAEDEHHEGLPLRTAVAPHEAAPPADAAALPDVCAGRHRPGAPADVQPARQARGGGH